MEELIKEAEEKLTVSYKAAEDYIMQKEIMLNFVNEEMSKRPDIFNLIDGNPLQMMYDNHRNHVNFMANVFKYSLFNVLVRIVPWVYKAYHNHDFSYDYFPIELNTWKRAIERFLPNDSAKEIVKTYDWLLQKHEKMIELSKTCANFILKVDKNWTAKKDKFLNMLLRGDYESALNFAQKNTKTRDEIENFYLNIVQSALYDIGILWENGKISVAEEHLATAIVGRIMATIYSKIPKKRKKLKAIVTSAPNEYHELGGRIVADMLEMDGWDVKHLGANVPAESIIKIVRKVRPKILAISATMPFNIERVADIIERIKEMETHKPKIIVGGMAFNIMPDIYKQIGADYWASDAKKAVEIARGLI